VAFRAGGRYVPRLVRRRPRTHQFDEFVARPHGTYIITGGLGGIGLAVARWLTECGARHLLLIGRTPLPARESWKELDPASQAGRRAAAVADLEYLGANVETASIDVGAEGELESYLEVRRLHGAPEVCGVIHAAGVLQFHALSLQDAASLRSGLAAKMLGAWHLHKLFRNEPLDLFVLCSSSSALLNSPLLGGYAAANAFLDALAHHRRVRRLAALSINWGTWHEVGMAADADPNAGAGMPKGAGTISTVNGLTALRELLAAGDAQAAVMPMDWPEFARAYPALAADPFLEEMIKNAGRGNDRSGWMRSSSLSSGLSDVNQPLAAEDYLRAEAARVLGMQPEGIDTALPLSTYGFDSLMAVQLKNRIESDLRAIVPIIQFLHGPSVEQLVPAVLVAVQAQPFVPTPVEAAAELWEEGTL
jgi:NAD(P)-dependent dehydrogenase (short-subunit alcohol dehydrogenase family)/acyl carrier protein